MSILPKLEGVNFMVNHLTKRNKKKRLKINVDPESKDKFHLSYFKDLSMDRIELKREKSLGKEAANQNKKSTMNDKFNHLQHRFSTCKAIPKVLIGKDNSSYDRPFSKIFSNNVTQNKQTKTSSNCNQTTSQTAVNQEIVSPIQDKENIRNRVIYKSVCLKAKESLKIFLDVCKKEELISLRNSKELRKSINSRNNYYNVSNPLTMQRDKLNKRLSLLINEGSKISISYMSKDKQRIFTSGNDSNITNCNIDLNPSTVFKFKDIIKEKYGEDVMFSKKKKIKDDAPLYIIDNPLPGEKLKAISEVKRLSLKGEDLY
jgi:hypothetical protein